MITIHIEIQQAVGKEYALIQCKGTGLNSTLIEEETAAHIRMGIEAAVEAMAKNGGVSMKGPGVIEPEKLARFEQQIEQVKAQENN